MDNRLNPELLHVLKDSQKRVASQDANRIISLLFMKITREAEYAFRCASFLARNPDTVFSVEEIASGTGVSSTFLAKILQKLQRAHLVRSFRGIFGGFSLAGSPKEISMFDVLSAMGDPLVFNDCVAAPESCSNSAECYFHSIWKSIRHSVEQQLRAAMIDPCPIPHPPKKGASKKPACSRSKNRAPSTEQ